MNMGMLAMLNGIRGKAQPQSQSQQGIVNVAPTQVGTNKEGAEFVTRFPMQVGK